MRCYFRAAAEPSARQRVEAFAHRLATPIGQLPEDHEAAAGSHAISPFRVVGVTTLLIGAMMLGILPYLTDALTYRLDLWIGVGLVLLGAAMVVGSWISRQPQGEST